MSVLNYPNNLYFRYYEFTVTKYHTIVLKCLALISFFLLFLKMAIGNYTVY